MEDCNARGFFFIGSNLEKTDFQKTVGLRIDEVIAYWKPIENWVPEIKEIETDIVTKMVDLIHYQSCPLPGVIETLDFKVKNSNRSRNLITSKLIDAVLKTLDVKQYFDAIQSAETETQGKPHPAVFLSAAKNECKTRKVFGDRRLFKRNYSAKAARMAVVCIPEKPIYQTPK